MRAPSGYSALQTAHRICTVVRPRLTQRPDSISSWTSLDRALGYLANMARISC